MKKLTIIFALTIFSLSINAQEYKAIIGATVIRTDKEGVITDATVVIKDNKIIKVGKSTKVKFPYHTKIIDAKGKFIIPGLVDGHIHFFQSGGLYTRPDGLDLRERVPYADEEVKWIKANIDDVFKRYMRCGITTVIDMGGPFWNFEVKEYSKNAKIAPRVFVTGPLIASYQPEALTTDDPPIIKVNSKEEAIKLVQKQVEKGADFIKIWYVILKDQNGEEFEPIVKAIIEEAHKHNKPVFVHAYELNESVKRAVKNGADVLVHSVKDKEVDKEFLKMAKRNGIKYIPTLFVFQSYSSVYSKQVDLLPIEHQLGNPKIIGSLYDMYELDNDELSARVKHLQKEKKPIETSPIILKNLKTVQDYGITVAAGTDAGNVGVIHGPALFHEFTLMKKAGLTNHEILVDATLNGAKLLNKEDKLGSIEVGKLADMVILNSNPLENIMNVTDINTIIKDGEFFKAEEILEYQPEDIAQIQLNAYNEKDLEAFLSVYSDSIEIFTFPDNKLLYKGKAQMRQVYSSFFNKAGDLHCELANRITYKNFVLDREIISSSIKGRESFDGQAIYQIEGNKIRKLWFIR
ncbi:MAG: amidohydrolase family protein [Bacteroidota bacterium]|nr:amidohydrolase family protein [Bacteroidota bacterium]